MRKVRTLKRLNNLLRKFKTYVDIYWNKSYLRKIIKISLCGRIEVESGLKFKLMHKLCKRFLHFRHFTVLNEKMESATKINEIRKSLENIGVL